ncbi:FMN reductase [Halobacteriales archaeon QS_5_70_17]|jgi:NAD(P)H-dependent FMN reductase|nr:MAG: FMN reductase [Halobacteriales archaeon QS_5_70_17]
MDDVRVAAVCGSLRDDSYTRLALERALGCADDLGAETDLIDLRDLDLPVFDPDREGVPAAEDMTERLRTADSVLLGSPVYHGSYTSALKNALDYSGFDEFENTTVGLLAVAGGAFPTGPLDHLRLVCRALNAWVIPHQAAVPQARTEFEDGRITDESLAERIDVLGRRAVEYANIEPDPRTVEALENKGAGD